MGETVAGLVVPVCFLGVGTPIRAKAAAVGSKGGGAAAEAVVVVSPVKEDEGGLTVGDVAVAAAAVGIGAPIVGIKLGG